VDAFLANLSASDRVGVWVHCDGDGLMSGVLASKAVERRTGKKPAVFFCSGYPSREGLQKKIDILRDARCDKVLILDLSLDQDDFVVKSLEPFAQVLFVDHHKVYNDLTSEKTVFVKANWVKTTLDPSRYPASKLAFDLFSRSVDLSDFAWCACIGVFADAASPAWKSFMKTEIAKAKTTLDEIKRCAQVIDAVGIIDHARFGELYECFLRARRPLDILSSPFAVLAADLESEMSFWMAEFKKNAEFFDDLEMVWFVFTPRFAVKSPLINRISFDLYPDKTVVLVQLLDGLKTANFSGRRQDGRVRINDLFEAAVKGIDGGSGGGHAPAAAGKVPREDLERFKQNMISELKKLYADRK
jgi:single-stranded DNA-specific DHH superfamily exonuclease